jgi:hypothetical protein
MLKPFELKNTLYHKSKNQFFTFAPLTVDFKNI